MTGNNELKKRVFSVSGFTLIEMMIAMSLFGIATVYSVNIFAQSNRVQKRTANIERVISDARYALEIMAREVRMDVVDYNYSGYISPLFEPADEQKWQTELALVDVNNNPIRFRRIERQNPQRWSLQFCKGTEMCSADVYYDVTPEGLSVEDLRFYITPAQDPFSLNQSLNPPVYYSNDQPLVTIVIKIQSLHPELKEEKISVFQTTITPRKYFR
jgi:prepilin-type N-terminal cleavage/methylation domain-containing protein